ncbi:MAG: radical SAM protein [Candidatus Sumerlaeaceae bacterium]|nr:radical SAM protein [Candidatus Sumerlaeaceae bacterium]
MDESSPTLMVSEIYLSIQGESSWAGYPCAFIRLSGCPLRCSYCDTEYAFTGGQRLRITEILVRVQKFQCPLVEVTGGEPLAQPRCTELLQALLEQGYRVLLETSGAFSIEKVPRDVYKIVDIKCPSSGEMERNQWRNLDLLAPHDEIKFVIGTRDDYEWAKAICAQYSLSSRCRVVHFSPVFGKLPPADLSHWILDDRLYDVRLQLQLHKFIWPPDTQGV